VQDVITEFKKHLKQASSVTLPEPFDVKRNNELHPSSFPYCGLRHLYEELKWGEPESRSIDLPGRYYTTFGTLIHEIFQDHLGKVQVLAEQQELDVDLDVKGHIVGDWHCPSCDILVAECSPYPGLCTKCRNDTFYKELGIKWGNYIVGHVDGLYLLRDSHCNEAYYVIDYKTTSTFAVNEHKRKGKKFPYLANKKQIESYCALLRDQHGLDIKGWMLVYLARDNPFINNVIVGEEITPEKHQTSLKRLKKYDNHFDLARSPTKENVRTLVQQKPCKKESYYWRHMHQFFNPCPLAEHQKCWAGDVEKNMLKLLKRSQND